MSIMWHESHRHDEFSRFLKKLERQTPRDLNLEMIVDNYATLKHPDVLAASKRLPVSSKRW